MAKQFAVGWVVIDPRPDPDHGPLWSGHEVIPGVVSGGEAFKKFGEDTLVSLGRRDVITVPKAYDGDFFCTSNGYEPAAECAEVFSDLEDNTVDPPVYGWMFAGEVGKVRAWVDRKSSERSAEAEKAVREAAEAVSA